jgi:hypothetical protein
VLARPVGPVTCWAGPLGLSGALGTVDAKPTGKSGKIPGSVAVTVLVAPSITEIEFC